MKVIKIISIINQGGEYSITTTYNEVDDNGAIVKRNVKAPTFYAVGDMLNHVKAIAVRLYLFYLKLRRRNRRKCEKVKEILMQTYTVVLPVLLGYIVWLLKNQKKDRDANSKGTMLLLRTQLIEYHAKYMQLGDIPSYAYQNFCEMYDAYHALGGNGMVTKMKQEIEELHIKRKGE